MPRDKKYKQYSRGRLLKLQGQDQVEENSRGWVAWMRQWAVNIAITEGKVSIDDLREIADEYDWHPHHDNCWGAIFREGPIFCKAGHRISGIPIKKGRENTVWKLVDEETRKTR